MPCRTTPERRCLATALLALLTAGAQIAAQDPDRAELLALLRDLGDSSRSGSTLRALQRQGSSAVLRLMRAHAATPDSQRGIELRYRAEAALRWLAARSPASRAATPDLLETLETTDDYAVVEASVASLAALAPYGEDPTTTRQVEAAVAALLTDVAGRWTSGEQSTRVLEAGRNYRWMTLPADLPRKRLEELLIDPGDPCAFVRVAAAERLAAHGSAALPALRRALHAEHPPAGLAAGLILKHDGTLAVRRAAAVAIARIDPAAPDATVGLAWLQSPRALGHERMMAVTALGNPRLQQVEGAVHLLVLRAREDDERLAIEAIAALGRLGPLAEAAVPTLQELSALREDGNHPRRHRARAAAAALARIQDDAPRDRR